MIKIVVDTNIVFSTFLNTNSRIAQILFSVNSYEFFAPDYVRFEIIKHKEKIKKIAKLSENDFLELYELVMKNITILNLNVIPNAFYTQAKTLCETIDVDDTAFVAVSKFVKGKLWSGDIKLLNGLIEKGYKNVIKTEELYQHFIESKKH